jgi:uridine kinase
LISAAGQAVLPDYQRGDCWCTSTWIAPSARHRQLWDIDTRDQLLAWRLQSSAAVSSILNLAADRRKGVDRPVVIAIDGPSCSGKSVLAAAIALRSGGSILEGDDFYRDTLPNLTAAQREAMSDATVVKTVIDWARLRDQALLPLRAGESATFQPYDWDADDGRLALPKTIPAADVIIVDGVYAARPELADLVDLAVYLGVDPQTRADRYTARDEDPEWRRFWERGETYYFSAVRPPADFDIQLDGRNLLD